MLKLEAENSCYFTVFTFYLFFSNEMRKAYLQYFFVSQIYNEQVNIQILNASVDYIIKSNRFTEFFHLRKLLFCFVFSLFLNSVRQSKRNWFIPNWIPILLILLITQLIVLVLYALLNDWLSSLMINKEYIYLVFVSLFCLFINLFILIFTLFF